MLVGKRLALNTVAEWRNYYVSYKRLKRITERVAASIHSHREALNLPPYKRRQSTANTDDIETPLINNSSDERLVSSGDLLLTYGDPEFQSPEFEELRNEFFEVIEKGILVYIRVY